MAHGRYIWRGEAALEGPAKHRLDGQNVLPLAAQPPTAGGIHQVRAQADPQGGLTKVS